MNLKAACVLLMSCLLPLSAGCKRDNLEYRAQALDSRMKAPEIPIEDIGHLSLELAGAFEDAKRFTQAEKYFKRAIWAFTMYENIQGDSHPLLDDAKEGLSRIKSREESLHDLEMANHANEDK